MDTWIKNGSMAARIPCFSRSQRSTFTTQSIMSSDSKIQTHFAKGAIVLGPEESVLVVSKTIMPVYISIGTTLGCLVPPFIWPLIFYGAHFVNSRSKITLTNRRLIVESSKIFGRRAVTEVQLADVYGLSIGTSLWSRLMKDVGHLQLRTQIAKVSKVGNLNLFHCRKRDELLRAIMNSNPNIKLFTNKSLNESDSYATSGPV